MHERDGIFFHIACRVLTASASTMTGLGILTASSTLSKERCVYHFEWYTHMKLHCKQCHHVFGNGAHKNAIDSLPIRTGGGHSFQRPTCPIDADKLGVALLADGRPVSADPQHSVDAQFGEPGSCQSGEDSTLVQEEPGHDLVEGFLPSLQVVCRVRGE